MDVAPITGPARPAARSADRTDLMYRPIHGMDHAARVAVVARAEIAAPSIRGAKGTLVVTILATARGGDGVAKDGVLQQHELPRTLNRQRLRPTTARRPTTNSREGVKAPGPAPAIANPIVASRPPAPAVPTVLAVIAAAIVAGHTPTATPAAIIGVAATGALVAMEVDQGAVANANRRRSGFHHPSFQQPGE